MTPAFSPEIKIERQPEEKAADGGISLSRLVDERVDQEKHSDEDENKRRISEQNIRHLMVRAQVNTPSL